MQYKDTLALYDDLIAGGCSETQARVQAKQIGGIGNLLDEIKKDLFWMRIIGGAIALAILTNGFVVLVSK